MAGWVKLHRSLAEHPRFGDPAWVSVWVYLLIHATHKPREVMFNGEIITLKPGQLVTGRRVISEKTGVHESKCKRLLTVLESDQQIARVRGSKSSLISILNWDEYQEFGQANDQQMTSKRPAGDQQVTTIQECKNIKNVRRVHSASADAVREREGYRTRKKRMLTGKRLETFERFWKAFAYPKGKAEAADAWLDIPELTQGLVNTICAAAEAEAKRRPDLIAAGRTPKWAQGWISGRRWEDGHDPVFPGTTRATTSANPLPDYDPIPLGPNMEPLDWKDRLNRLLDEIEGDNNRDRVKQWRKAATWRDVPPSLAEEIDRQVKAENHKRWMEARKEAGAITT